MQSFDNMIYLRERLPVTSDLQLWGRILRQMNTMDDLDLMVTVVEDDEVFCQEHQKPSRFRNIDKILQSGWEQPRGWFWNR